MVRIGAVLCLLACAICALFCSVTADDLNNKNLVTIRKQIRDAIESDMSLLGGLVRLSFHDCVGGCDGCINRLNQDNAGLQKYIDIMEPVLEKIKKSGTDLTRADFWALAGTEAVYYAASLAPTQRGCGRRCPPRPVPDLKFYAGRKDCTTSSPNGSPWTNDQRELPSAHWDTNKVLDYFKRTFGFGTKATTAIMGAHTIGMTHPDNSGFHHRWVVRSRQLDNQFFVHMQNLNVGWHQTSTGTGRPVSGRPPRGPRPQQYMWITGADQNPQTMMMNSDMSLIKDLSDMSSIGKATCEYEKCPKTKEATLDYVKAYAADNAMFMVDFSDAFQSMTKNGYTNLREIASN